MILIMIMGRAWVQVNVAHAMQHVAVNSSSQLVPSCLKYKALSQHNSLDMDSLNILQDTTWKSLNVGIVGCIM